MSEDVTAWPWVSIQDGAPMLRLKDEGAVQHPVALQERFRRMPTAELKQLDGKTGTRAEVIAATTEAFFRGLLDETGQAHLIGLLDEEEETRRQRQERARWRARFPYLDDEELAELRQQAGGGR